ncbi:hypothetical protein DBR00_19465 [Pseudomonas sp. HMWF032]|nr:hypothetical protein DBR00_19465 [Pseudomonas sp. HMWF032]PTT84311.1 hypothetical protein DBR41_08255 [Pseudomonas sp. HMWF010]
MLLAASTYGVGQLANLVFQLFLLRLLGTAEYGVVGLAHLLLMTLIFVADLGYASLFLREPRQAPEWPRLWRCGLGHKLIATLLLLVLGIGGWLLLASKGSSQSYLLSAAPACLFALFNFSSPTIAGGQRLVGLLLGQIAWPAALLCWWLLHRTLSLDVAITAGLAVSLGYLLQALINVLYSRQAILWLPMRGVGNITAAMHLSTMAVCGTLHDRLTAFLLAPLAPSYLPFYLLLNHVISGLAGIQAQLGRLLLAEAESQQGRLKIVSSASVLTWATAAVLVVGLLLQDVVPAPEYRYWLGLSAIVVLIWSLSAASGFLVLLLISARLERQFMRPFLVTLAVSAVLQVAVSCTGEGAYLLWARVLGGFLAMAALLCVIKLRLSQGGAIALMVSLIACAAGTTSWYLLTAAVLALPLLGGLYRLPPCYLITPR